MRILIEAFMDVDPFDFELSKEDVDYSVVYDLIKKYPDRLDIDDFSVELDGVDYQYDEMLADEARREQDYHVSEYFKGLL